jgi:hypothetical protein
MNRFNPVRGHPQMTSYVISAYVGHIVSGFISGWAIFNKHVSNDLFMHNQNGLGS